MKNKCDCYHIENVRQYTYHPVTREPIGHDIGIGVCWGTKEMDECDCGGDKIKCDFYPEVREKAERVENIKEAISHFKYGVSHDIFKEPVTTYAKLAISALEKEL